MWFGVQIWCKIFGEIKITGMLVGTLGHTQSTYENLSPTSIDLKT